MIQVTRWTVAVGVLILAQAGLNCAAPAAETSRGDQMLAAYFREETQKLADACLANVKSFNNWSKHREEYQQQLREMLGLDPLPEKTPLNAVVTGKLDHDNFTVENLHFQSRPHLYATGNLYLPKNGGKPAPTILYVCGHHLVKEDGVSFGNKTWYQHHGAWFAQNGYVCLVIDTLQLGEIEGSHRGTRDEEKWWWNARGYTPAGVETWNALRAVDYLASRPEVDAERIGVTGRSGGGAYSWYLAALDDRIKVSVPVAGVTSLKNHVVDGCVTGHCDCMYFVNTYGWDYAQVAALTTPRPLLIANTDRDEIFPLDGVTDIYRRVRRLYELDKKGPDIALQLTPGPHSDSQVLQLQALHWFNQYLKGDKEPAVIESAAKKYFTPQELQVFDKLPADEINTRIDETFVPLAATPAVPESPAQWESQREKWMTDLREKCFRGWPVESKTAVTKSKSQLQPVFDATVGDVQFRAYDFDSQEHIRLRLYLVLPSNVPPAKLAGLALRPMTNGDWKELLSSMQIDFAKQLAGEVLPQPSADSYAQLKQILSTNRGVAFVAPRGIGPTAWSGNAKQKINILRRFMLLGQTLDGMRVWDVRCATQAVRSIDGLANVPLSLIGDEELSGIALYAALFEPNIEGVYVHGLPKTHRIGPNFLNVLRYLDIPQAVAMVAQRSHVGIDQHGEDGWEYPLAVSKKLGWADRIKISDTSADAGSDTSQNSP
jgi:dienelactone hydrolase